MFRCWQYREASLTAPAPLAAHQQSEAYTPIGQKCRPSVPRLRSRFLGT